MEKVTGIGGFFFPAKDPDGLARWYRHHLGIDLVPGDYDHPPWRQQGGDTIFAPFATLSDPVKGGNRPFILNFRVRNLDAMTAQLEASDIVVTPDPDSPYPNGKFAWLSDPEGNPIELWEPTEPRQ